MSFIDSDLLGHSNNLDADIRRTYPIFSVNYSKRRYTDGSVPFILYHSSIQLSMFLLGSCNTADTDKRTGSSNSTVRLSGIAIFKSTIIKNRQIFPLRRFAQCQLSTCIFISYALNVSRFSCVFGVRSCF